MSLRICKETVLADHPPLQREECEYCRKHKDGTLLSEERAILDRWREYFSELFNPTQATQGGRTGATLGAENSFTVAEVARAIKSLKSGKAAGVDEIRPEMLKALGHSCTDLLRLGATRANYELTAGRPPEV